MRYVGVDYGSKKIGLALSDETGSMAFPHSVVPNDASFFEILDGLIEREQVGEMVVGHSLDREGQDNKIQAAINEFVTDVTLRYGIPVHLESELYSSREAERIQGKGDLLDAAAAAIILNSYLSKK